jgi:APA family basic amino acid/polyamine antiporter
LKRLLPEQWKKSPLHISDGASNILVALAVGIFILQAVLLGSSLTTPLLLGNIGVVVFAFIFANVRYNSGKVKCEVSYEIEE